MNKKVFEGDLTAKSGEVYPYTEITGSVIVPDGVTADLGVCTSVGGNVYVCDGGKLDLRACTSIGGNVYVCDGGKLNLGACTSIGGNVYVYKGGKLNLGACTSIGWGVYVYKGGKLNLGACTSVGGNVYVSEGGKLNLRACTSIGGGVYVSKGGKLNLGACTSVGGNVYVSEGGKLNLRACTSIGGGVYVSEGGKLNLGACTSIGGYVYVSEGGKLDLTASVKKNDPTAASHCRALLMSSFAAAGFSFADGILARIVSKRGPVSRVIICGKTDVSYLVTNGDAWSHGKTLAEARDGLIYKIGSRDTSEYKKWTLDGEITKAKAIQAYRAITGACEGEVRAWVESRKTPDVTTVRGIIEITEGAYGSEAFAKFFRLLWSDPASLPKEERAAAMESQIGRAV